MESGFVKLWRKIQHNKLYPKNRAFTHFEAWIDLMMQANGVDREVNFRNEYVPVKRGSFLTSELKLCDRWEWSLTKVRNFLKQLSENLMITDEKRYSRFTMITVLEYETYNPRKEQKDKAEVKQTIRQKNTTNKDKEVKEDNIREENIIPKENILKEKVAGKKKGYIEFYEKYPRHIEPKTAERAWGALSNQDQRQVIEVALPNYIEETKGKEKKFIKYPATFLRKEVWKDYLGESPKEAERRAKDKAQEEA